MILKSIKRFLQFNKRERWGMLALVGSLLGLYGLSTLFPPRLPASQPSEKIGSLGNLMIENQPVKRWSNDIPSSPARPFDPNLISESEWLELGISARTARTIRNYITKGGRFRSGEDLRKIWGMDSLACERLIPFVSISNKSEWPSDQSDQNRHYRNVNRSYPPTPRREWPDAASTQKTRVLLDINRSDSVHWEALPGIGPGYARRILRYRERLGGFIHPNQIGETYQLPDSVFQRIRPFLSDHAVGSVRTLSLNEISVDSLGRHPYCGFAKAKLIVRYREQHGPFQKIDDLLNVVTVDESWLLRLRPYLTLQ